MLHILLLLPTLLISFSSLADESIELYIPNSPPLAWSNIISQGITITPIITALEQTKKNITLRETPWPRAQKEVSSGRNKLIAPLARTALREDKFTWIAPILETKNVMFTLGTPARSFSEARRMHSRIGVGQGSAQAETLVENGFPPKQLVHIKLGENPGRLLRLGRIDAWFTSTTEGNYIWRNRLNEMNPLKSSPILTSTTLYLACSIDCDPNLITELRSTLIPSANPTQNNPAKNQ